MQRHPARPRMPALPLPNSRRWLGGVLVATLAFRAWLSWVVPFTADEAYFLLWGRVPDIGYYDHPPMIGWWLALLRGVSESEPWLRLPATLLPAAVALMTHRALTTWFAVPPDTADWAAICVLLVPMNVWNVFITTDTPLVLFSVGSVLALARAQQTGERRAGLAAGVLLGLAFLSKYFAVLLALSYLAWAVTGRSPLRWRALGWVLLGALPLGLVNLYWNLGACWSNIMFNAINRHDDAGWSWRTPVLYLLTLAYLAAPLLVVAWRSRRALRRLAPGPASGVLMAAAFVPLALFAVLSFSARIGLHWLLSFLPPLVACLALVAGVRALATCGRVLAWVAAAHVMVAVAIALLPLDRWRHPWLHPRLVMLAHTDEVLARAASTGEGYELATDAYSLAALFAYHSGRHVPVFGTGSSHARHDDIRTDWRRYDGRDLMVLRREPPPPETLQPYFREVAVHPIEVRGARFHVALGRGFDYAAYRRGVLREVRDRYYRIPPLLPVRGCYFCARYFPGAQCVPGAPA